MSSKKTYKNRDKYEQEQMKNYEYRTRPYSTGGSPSHMTVMPRKNEHPERTIKRFLKKCKKEGIIDQFREKMHFEKPSVKKRKKAIKRKRAIEKLQTEQKNK